MVIDPEFWRGRRVFLTGHTGFKGAWMCLLLRRLGAIVHGYALPPATEQDVFVTANIANDVHHTIGDIRDAPALTTAVSQARPEIVIHFAAQSLVRVSYAEPVETYSTNVMGTVHLLEAVRSVTDVKAVLVVTSDKCYENGGWPWGYRESDHLGGHDPYSSSKGCAELVVSAYRRSFFQAAHPVAVASGRAGNVVGGGDWAQDRLVPDAIRAFRAGIPLLIRNPDAVRPWQHVLDPLLGYLVLIERLVEDGAPFAEAWNFGPSSDSEIPVGTMVDGLVSRWGKGATWQHDRREHPHEATFLKLDCSKAHLRLGWRPLISIDEALQFTVEWYAAFQAGVDMRYFSSLQIGQFLQGVPE